MKKQLPFLFFLLAIGANAQVPIFNPSMSVETSGYVYSPDAEQVYNIIDGDIETKFLDFSYYDGLGFTVDLGGPSAMATSMDITTANDSAERDPTEYVISGSVDGVYFTEIATGSIECDIERYYTRNYTFENTEYYNYYRLNFLYQCNTIESMIQVAEVQLFESSLSVNTIPVSDNDFKLYPNPGNGHFFISQKGTQYIDHVTVTDALGKVVRDLTFGKSGTAEINMEDAAAGIYFVKIDTDQQSLTKKLVVD